MKLVQVVEIFLSLCRCSQPPELRCNGMFFKVILSQIKAFFKKFICNFFKFFEIFSGSRGPGTSSMASL